MGQELETDWWKVKQENKKLKETIVETILEAINERYSRHNEANQQFNDAMNIMCETLETKEKDSEKMSMKIRTFQEINKGLSQANKEEKQEKRVSQETNIKWERRLKNFEKRSKLRSMFETIIVLIAIIAMTKGETITMEEKSEGLGIIQTKPMKWISKWVPYAAYELYSFF